jgi:hypothetical protein
MEIQKELLELYNYFWNCEEVDYDDSGENRYRDVVNLEFDDKMCELFGDALYDLESVVMNLNIGEWIIPHFSDLHEYGYTESMIRQIDSNLEGHSLIELNQSFIDLMKEING